jgi:putative ABC transport system permease protein
LSAYTFHITPYDLLFLGTIFIGLTFALLLWFTKKTHRGANRFLGLFIATIVLWIAWILGIHIRLGAYFPHWSWLPLRFSLTLGPLIYFYVLKITRPDYQLRWKDMLHFSPLLLEQGVLLLEIKASIRTGAATYDTLTFRQLNPVLQLLAFVSVIIYLYGARKLIESFYRHLKFTEGDRYRNGLQWLHRLLTGCGLLWLVWIFYAALGYFYFHHQSGLLDDYPLYLLLAVVTIWMATVAFSRPEVGVPAAGPSFRKPSPPPEMKQRGTWLKKIVEANLYYQDPELTLRSLAETLNLSPNELSRIINMAFGKNFNDFINEYRIREVTRKMQDPAYDRMTLLGIALDAGFNSKSTFNRTFRQMTGKSPAEYKRRLEKERPSYTLRPYSRAVAIISYQETTPKWSPDKLNRNYMFRNYLKTAWRNFTHNKFYSALNIIGLTVGLTIGMLILLWVNDELNFDGFHRQAKQIYQVNSVLGTGLSKGVYSVTPGSVAYYSLKETPGVLNAVRITNQDDFAVISYKDKNLTDNRMVYTEPSLFQMFDYPLIEGSARNPFPTDHSVVITAATAKKYFGNTDPIGKVLQGDHKENFVVSAVIKDFPENSSLQCDILFSAELFKKAVYGPGPGHSIWPSLDDDFGNYQWETYLLLKPGAAAKPIVDKLLQISIRHKPNQKLADIGSYQLQPLTETHLYAPDGSSSAMQTVKIFSLVALLILLIASINYVNLSTARAMLRAKEVSVRKIIGAARKQLIAQFVIETLLFFAISLGFALLAIALLMPFYNDLAGKQMHFDVLAGSLWKVIGLTALATLIASSIYPALLLSSFKPINALKGKISLGVGNTVFRKILVVGQFTFSIGLIIGTLVINRQLGYIRNMALGYEKTNVFSLPMRNMQDHYTAVRTELLKQPGILDVTSGTQSIINIQGATLDVDWDGKDPRGSYFIHSAGIDQNFFTFFKLKLTEGSGFTGAKTDTARLILNETAVKEAGIKNPIGKRFRFGQVKGIIAGVVKDFHFTSLKQKIQPFIFYYQPSGSRLFVKTTGKNAQSAIKAVEATWKSYNPAFSMEYGFMDEAYNKLYQSDQRTGLLFDLFAGVATDTTNYKQPIILATLREITKAQVTMVQLALF